MAGIRSSFFVGAGLIVCLAGAGSAQTAEEILAANRTARGSDEAWSEVEALQLTTTLNQNGREYSLTVQRLGPDRVRMDKQFPERSELFIWDGRQGWLEQADESRQATDDEVVSRLMQVDVYLPWREPWQRFDRVEYVGETEAEGKNVHELAIHRGSEVAEKWYVSTEDHQIVKTLVTLAARDGGTREVGTYRFDFRETDGLVFPHYIEIDFGTGLISQIPEAIQINPDLDEASFVVPDS